MRKFVALFLVTTIGLLGAWLWVYQSYIEVQDSIMQKYECGDWDGAVERLQAYQASSVSYPVYNFPFLERLRLRLRYHEGVTSGRLGDMEGSEVAFRDATRSDEPDIAAKAFYNLALYAIEKGDLESARSLLSSALRLSPGDVDAKVNLELVLMRIRLRRLQAGEMKKRAAQVSPGEQWRHGIEKREGEGSVKSRRSYL